MNVIAARAEREKKKEENRERERKMEGAARVIKHSVGIILLLKSR